MCPAGRRYPFRRQHRDVVSVPVPHRSCGIDLGFEWVEFWNWRDKDLDAIRRTTEDGCPRRTVHRLGFEPGLNDPANHVAFESVESVRRRIDSAQACSPWSGATISPA